MASPKPARVGWSASPRPCSAWSPAGPPPTPTTSASEPSAPRGATPRPRGPATSPGSSHGCPSPPRRPPTSAASSASPTGRPTPCRCRRGPGAATAAALAGVLRRSRADDLLGVTPMASTCRSNHLGYPSELDMAVEFFLLNPLTRERIQLPPLDTREVLQSLALEPGGGYVVRGRPGPDFSCDLEYIRRHLVSRLVLSSDPTSGDCVSMASFCYGASFAVCRPGSRDSSWTALTTSPLSSFHDIVFYWGRFYTVDTRLVLYVCDVGPLARIQQFPCFVGDWTACAMEGCLVRGRRRWRGQVIERVYLVESCGELLMVLKTHDDVPATPGAGEEEDEHWPMLDFEVYKLDVNEEPAEPPRCRWVELESLDDRVLLLGPGHPFSLSAGDFMDGCPGNCIYFSDYRPGRQTGAVHGEPDFGVFHVGDARAERVRCCPVDPGSVWQPSLWISPSRKITTSCWE